MESEFESGQDASWIAHLEAIKRRLGPDGIRAAQCGVQHIR
jgi:hypothetical protein